MKNHYELLKRSLAAGVSACLDIVKAQNDAKRLEAYLFTATADKGLTDGSNFVWMFPNFIAGYYLPDSPYHHDRELLEWAYAGLCRYEGYLHEDGSADLLSTNFHDPAQTGFHTQGIFPIMELLVRFTEHTPLEDKLYEKCLEVLRKMGHAMATLGFHTPNHRWVISSALAVAYRYTGEKEFLNAIERFLMEGIDCDEYGEYTERSTGAYNNICNFSFTIMALALGQDEFFEYPRRNLRLMLHFTEPDGTVNTLNSSRWDNGGQFRIDPYYDFYLLLALLDGDAEFAYMADHIIGSDNKLPVSTHVSLLLMLFALRPELKEGLARIEPQAPAKDQSIFLPNSKIARMYLPEHNMTMTTLASRAPVFFQMNYGSSLLQARFAGSFFGDPHSQFRARTIQKTENGYRLICDEKAGYRSQFAEKPDTSNWRKMDHSKRDIINVQNFHTEITVTPLPDGATLEIEASGCERIPTKLELSMQAGGKFFTESIAMYPKEGDYVFLRDGKAEYFLDAYRSFEITGGGCKHMTGSGMRGTAPVDPKKFTVALTDATPHKTTVTIRVKNLLKP